MLNLSHCAGAGIGLRIPHIKYVLNHQPEIPWFEVHPCNFLRGGLNRQLLYRIAERYPLSFHGVNLNLGGIDPIDVDYLQRLKTLVGEIQPGLISDHACFTSLDQNYYHDLLPIPYSRTAVTQMASRVMQVQDILQQQILIENVSRYTSFPESTLSEAEFLNEVCYQAGCKVLLDLNNAYVNQLNLGISVDGFLAELNLQLVAEVHLAGHSTQGDYVVDTHNKKVCNEVWDIYRAFVSNNPGIPCLIEWDSDLPDFSVLEEERNTAQDILKQNSINNLSFKSSKREDVVSI